MDDVRRVEELVRQLNQTWTQGRPEDLGPFFHPQVIAVPPGDQEPMVGREAMVESFRQYARNAITHSFEETGLKVDVIGPVAVARLGFKVDYSIGEERYQESGRDLLVLHQTPEGWQIVWRTQMTG